MNKMIKFPLFLGVVGIACGASLALVNGLTKPVVDKAKADKENAAYVEIYKEYNVAATDIKEVFDIPDTMTGCSKKVVVEKEGKIIGATYSFAVKGYGGQIEFMISYADNKLIAYTDIANNESPGYGKDVIAAMNDTIKDHDASQSINSNSAYTSLISGKSVTGNAIKAAIESSREDYLNSIK